MLRRFTLALILILVFSMSLFAHPHMFIENKTTLLFDSTGLSGVRLTWTFDEMFSASLIQDCDVNKNGVFDKSEISTIKVDAFDALEDYHYFVYIVLAGVRKDAKTVENFSARIVKANTVEYSFTVPWKYAFSALKDVTIGVYDPSIFCQIEYAPKTPVSVKGINSSQLKTTIVDYSQDFNYDGSGAIEELKFSYIR